MANDKNKRKILFVNDELTTIQSYGHPTPLFFTLININKNSWLGFYFKLQYSTYKPWIFFSFFFFLLKIKMLCNYVSFFKIKIILIKLITIIQLSTFFVNINHLKGGKLLQDNSSLMVYSGLILKDLFFLKPKMRMQHLCTHHSSCHSKFTPLHVHNIHSVTKNQEVAELV